MSTLTLATAIGYLLGSIPFADRISRWHGVDIFTSGTGLAGASNVKRCVGTKAAVFVLLGDLSKGAASVLVARYLGVSGTWVLLAALAAIVGHWRSVFSRFRGGDGIATVGGIVVALFPVFGVVAVGVSLLVSLGGQRLPYSSLWNIVAGYVALAALALRYDGDLALALGVGGLCALVLARAIYGHLRRRRVENWEGGQSSESVPDRP